MDEMIGVSRLATIFATLGWLIVGGAIVLVLRGGLITAQIQQSPEAGLIVAGLLASLLLMALGPFLAWGILRSFYLIHRQLSVLEQALPAAVDRGVARASAEGEQPPAAEEATADTEDPASAEVLAQQAKLRAALVDLPEAVFQGPTIARGSGETLAKLAAAATLETAQGDQTMWHEIAFPVFDQELECLSAEDLGDVVAERAYCAAGMGTACSGDFCYPGCAAYLSCKDWQDMLAEDSRAGDESRDWHDHYADVIEDAAVD